MVDDPDARWKPGLAPGSHRDPPAGPAPNEPTPAGTSSDALPDRFLPAAGRRRAQAGRALATSPAAPSAAEPTAIDPTAIAVSWINQQPADASRPSRRRPPLVAALVALVASIAVAVAVALAMLGDDGAPRRPEPGELRGADERRLPAEVDELWSTVLPGSGNALASSVLVDGHELVVAVVDDGSRDRSMIVGIDASTGDIRWRRGLSYAPLEVSLLGVFDDVVLVEQNDLSSSRLIGLEAADGETRWERRTPGSGANTVLLGTGLVGNLSTVVADQLTFLDPASGTPVGEYVGELMTTDLAGIWYARRGSSLVALDLAGGWSDPELVVDDLPVPAELAVVDGRLLAAGERGQLLEVTGSGVRPVEGAGELPLIDSMFPAGGSSFVGLGDGALFGAELVENRVRVTWERIASLRGFALTERGLAVTLSEPGSGLGAGDLVVVDGVTGDRLAGTIGGPDAGPLIVGDGIVAVAEDVDGAVRVGYDLDGAELWRLPAAGKLSVGDRLLVVMADTPAGYRLTAFGSSG